MKKVLPLQSFFDKRSRRRGFGALDEWLSQRSAKPSTAVRIRQAPQKDKREQLIVPVYLFLLFFGMIGKATKIICAYTLPLTGIL